MSKEAEIQLDADQTKEYKKNLLDNSITEFGRIHSARGSARAMKVIGTIGLFALGAAASVAAIVASGGAVAAPTAAALMALAESSASVAGISGILTGVGIAREGINKRHYARIRKVFGFRLGGNANGKKEDALPATQKDAALAA